jgi:hypothetical protein
MQLIHPSPDVALLGLRAMKMVACAPGQIAAPARRLLDAAQTIILRTAHDIDALPPITPEELAAGMTDPALREQFVDGMLVMSLTAGVPPERQLDVVGRFADALGVASPYVHDLHLLARRQMLLFRLDFMRRGHIADMVRQQYEDAGLLGTIKALLGLRGVLADPAVAAPYLALAELPAGTLGRALSDHYRGHGFAFPGEKHGFPEAGVYHDLSHVLSGYGTDPEGELEVGAFVTGFRRDNPIAVLLFVMLTFSAGVNVTPLPQPHLEGILERPGLAERMLRALERGARMKVDLSDRWDFWPYLARPIEDVRRELGVLP